MLGEQKGGIFAADADTERHRDKVRSAAPARLQFLFNREAQESDNELTFGSKSYENNHVLGRSQNYIDYSEAQGNSM
jgi:hypothetical protein